MTVTVRNLFFGLLGLTLPVCLVGAQVRVGESNLRKASIPLQEASGPQSTLEDELHQMLSQAGVIFAGQVMSVHQQAGVGWVEVEFRVEEAIRGCVGQGTYRLREWAGLWSGGANRYRVGQRLLMLLHAPGASGLSSPVGGQDGVIPIVGAGSAPKPEDDFVDAGEQAVDLRWIQARLLRSQANGGRLHARSVVPAEPVYVGKAQESLVTRKTGVPEVRNNLRLGPVNEIAGMTVGVAINPPGATNALAEGATLRGVLAMLGAWEAQQSNAAQ